MAEYIERKAALNFEVDSVLLVPSALQPFMDGMAFYAEHIKRLPAADVREVKRGKWEYTEMNYDDYAWVCSVCGETWVLNDGTPAENNMNFCPNCGADMREPPKEET